jgi:hypothetical protein
VDGAVLLELALVESQLAPLVVVTCTVNGIPDAPDALVTLIVCVAGLLPCCALNASDVGDTVTLPVLPPLVEDTVSETETVCTTPFTLKDMVAL